LKFLLFTISLQLFSSFVGLSQKLEEKELTLQPCSIDFYRGINNALLRNATLKEVQNIFGSTQVLRKRIPFDLAMGAGYSVKYLIYSELGCEFRFSNRGVKFRKRKLTRIILRGNSKCKTVQGIGIGSKYSELPLESFKQQGWRIHTDYHVNTLGDKKAGYYVWLYKKIAGGGTLFLNFYSQTNSLEHFKIERIELAYNPSLQKVEFRGDMLGNVRVVYSDKRMASTINRTRAFAMRAYINPQCFCTALR